MSTSSASSAGARRWRRTLRVAAILVGAAPVLIAAAAATASPTAPPPVSVLTSHSAPGREDIFITPTGDAAQYANGPEIIDRNGKAVWFHPIPEGQTAADFRVQRYRGQRVLTWWQGTGLGGLATSPG